MKRLKLFETAKQWRDHRRGVHKLLTNDTVYEDLVFNYVTNPEPTPMPEFQLVPDVLDSNQACARRVGFKPHGYTQLDRYYREK